MQASISRVWNELGDLGTVSGVPSREKSPTSREAIAERLKLTRMACSPSQAAFAKLTGISTQAWNNYEKDVNRISLDQARKLCERIGVTLDWIYRGEMYGLPMKLAADIQKIAAEPAKRAG